ncbi:MAG TPA: hypothetical protein PK593_08925, partial [Thermomicrobiales bacterium]|nr:hypothetical protein [Thermomicrobiales bacterium]
TAWGLARLDRRIVALPPVTPNPGETTAEYFTRQQQLLNERIVPLTLAVIRETFVIAAVVCVVAVGAVALLRNKSADDQSVEPLSDDYPSIRL